MATFLPPLTGLSTNACHAYPTAHAVGYDLPPLAGLFQKPGQAARNYYHTLLSVAVIVLAANFGFTPELPAADKYTLDEPVTDARVFRVSHQLKVNGQLEAAIGDGKAVSYAVTEDDDVVISRSTIAALGSLDAIFAHFDAAEFVVPALVVADAAHALPPTAGAHHVQ